MDNIQRYNALQRRLEHLERVHLDGKNAVSSVCIPFYLSFTACSTKQRLNASNETFRVVKTRSLSRLIIYTSRKGTMTLWNLASVT